MAQTADTARTASTGTGVASGVTLPRANVYALTSDNAIYLLRPGASQYTRLGRVNTPDGGNLIGIDFRPADNTPWVEPAGGNAVPRNLHESQRRARAAR